MRSSLHECIENVSIDLYDENDSECMRAIKPFGQPIINPDALNIWKSGYIRLFLSHRDGYKKEAAELATALESYGVSGFVAHNTIEPMEKWQHIILRSLQSMEIMLAFVTDDFFDSYWTNQEIGFALAKGVPIIPLKMQKKDPCGFISDIQALPGDIQFPAACVDGIHKVLVEKLGKEERIKKATLQAFLSVSDFNDVPKRFDRLQAVRSITQSDIQEIIDAYGKNKNLYDAYYLKIKNRLVDFLEDRTGKKYLIERKTIKESKEDSSREF